MYRLPTETEWEYAARSGKDDACRYANVHDRTSKSAFKDFIWENHNCDDGYAVTAPVGSFQPNVFGMYDMMGNVWEWTNDWYGKDYYSSSPRNNPQGPSSGDDRVMRGGSWNVLPGYVRASNRLDYTPSYRYYNVGFRLARRK